MWGGGLRLTGIAASATGALLVASVCQSSHASAKVGKALVTCEPTVDGVACLVLYGWSERPARLCWDAVLQCRNGARVTAHACVWVRPNRLTMRSIAARDLDGVAACDDGTAFSVTHLAFVE